MTNRKAYYEYFIIEEYTAGIVLHGSEVKSLRDQNASFNDSYIYIENNTAKLKNFYISKNKNSSYLNHEELREKELLLNKKEIAKIKDKVKTSGFTIIPLQILQIKGRFKLLLALAKGKKLWNKKDSLKEKDLKRETKRELNF